MRIASSSVAAPTPFVEESSQKRDESGSQVIDRDGYRPNVGIILSSRESRVFWGRRIGQNAWQFPQGGICAGESPEEAMFRELYEETGLLPHHVEVVGCTRGWLRYQIPKRLIRRGPPPVCVGQKQRWFMLRLVGGDEDVRLDSTDKPEFDHWRWVSYWYPVRAVVPFKRGVYQKALRELAPLVFPSSARGAVRACDQGKAKVIG
ncbi:RNA pyrophosphohydrolase [Ectothiorhodospiraceae bacterium 2226]|nr:RNA pyrophosphohydrolase [Ectothiorhodospiraceae bacterium 2226]